MQDSLAVDLCSHMMRYVESCANNAYSAACYRFYLYGAFHENADPIQKTNAYCATLTSAQRLGCFNGVGADWYYLIYRQPAAINALCSVGDASDIRMCMEGALELLNVYYPGESKKVCAAYTGDSAQCTAAARYRNFDMRRDLTLYLGL